MRTSGLGYFAGLVLFFSVTAQATPIVTENVSGTFVGGGTFSGFISIDFAGVPPCLPLSNPDAISGSFTTAGGSIPGSTYDVRGAIECSGNGYESLGFENLTTGGHITISFNPAFTAAGGQLGVIAQEISSSGDRVRFGPGTAVSDVPVPEPATIALLGVGLLAGLGFARRRLA